MKKLPEKIMWLAPHDKLKQELVSKFNELIEYLEEREWDKVHEFLKKGKKDTPTPVSEEECICTPCLNNQHCEGRVHGCPCHTPTQEKCCEKYKSCKYCGKPVINPLRTDYHFKCLAVDYMARKATIDTKDIRLLP